MPEFIEKTLFERALLASRLVDAAELVELAARLPTDLPGFNHQSDDRLAERLVARGLLNPWQIDQLRAGRTKFTLGPYLIVDAIGKGGMGHLFKGQHELLGRIEAIKVLPKTRSSSASVASFHHEIRAQSQLDHPNLVRVSFAGRDGDTHYLVTEFVPGVDLRRLVRRVGALPPDQAASVVLQTADALEYAHRRGLVHRDVKPGNLLVRPDGRVKVTDLGLAWYLDDSFGAAPTGDGKIVGTSDYIAPESIRTPDKIVPVSDIYALGCTLYYAVTGKVPYPGGNTSSKMQRHLRDEPINPRSFNPDLPAGIAGLIAEMMHKDHHQRTPSAAVVADRLQRFVRDDTHSALAELVEQADHGAYGPGGVNGPPWAPRSPAAGDIGETLAALSDDAVGSTGPDAVDETAGPNAALAAVDENPRLGESGGDAIQGAAPSSEDARATTLDHPVRLTVAAALGATVAIVAAAAMRYW